MTNGQARLPVSDLEEVRYLIKVTRFPARFVIWGALLLARSLSLGRWRRPLTKLRFPRFKLRSLVSSQNVRNLRHGPRMCDFKFHLDLCTCLCGRSYGCLIERRAKRCGFTLVEGS